MPSSSTGRSIRSGCCHDEDRDGQADHQAFHQAGSGRVPDAAGHPRSARLAEGKGPGSQLSGTEIFYSLLPEARGQGYAKEAAKAVTEWALGAYRLPYLIATVETGNIASQKVVESCGYMFIDERRLLIHILGERRMFRYYRRYASLQGHETEPPREGRAAVERG